MTREEATEELKILKENYWDDDGYGHETKQYDDTMFALDMALKALEQEPIIDKVRVEVEKLDYLSIEDGSDGYDRYIDQQDVLQILDKYKAESEEIRND